MRFNFTDRSRRVLARALEEAVTRRHAQVGTEHLLLSLLREEEGVSAAVLAALGVDSREMAERLSSRVGSLSESGGVAPTTLPYTAAAKRVLEAAMGEARRLGHGYVGTEHLLLGLLGLEAGAPPELEAAGATLSGAREAAERIQGGGAEAGAEPGAGVEAGAERGEAGEAAEGAKPRTRPGRSDFRMRIDDASTSSIYEQIVAQVQEAVATKRLREGERLPTVRRLADELDIAPGTVARAYGELERRGVVETAGVRGTRVAATPAGEGDGSATELEGLLRPVAVAAFHLGASAGQLRAALDRAMRGILAL